MTPNYDIGELSKERFKELMQQNEITVLQLAAQTGIHEQTLFRYQREGLKTAKVEYINIIAKALFTNPAYLIGYSDNPGINLDQPLMYLPVLRIVPDEMPYIRDEYIDKYVSSKYANDSFHFCLVSTNSDMDAVGIRNGTLVTIDCSNLNYNEKVVAAKEKATGEIVFRYIKISYSHGYMTIATNKINRNNTKEKYSLRESNKLPYDIIGIVVTEETDLA